MKGRAAATTRRRLCENVGNLMSSLDMTLTRTKQRKVVGCPGKATQSGRWICDLLPTS